MRRLQTILLSALLALSLTGCSKPDPREIYDAASKKSAELTDVDMSYDMDMKMIQGEDTLDMTSTMDMKMTGVNTDSMRYYGEGTTSTMGQEIPMSMYYEDGYYYMSTMDQKFKYAMDLETMMEQVKQSVESANMDSAYLTEITAKKDGDNQVLTYTADASKLDSYVQDMMGMVGAGMEDMDVSYTISEMSGEAVVNKDGYFSSSKVQMKLDMTMEGETISMEMDMDAVYHNPGQPVTIDAPDLEGYTEIDPSLLGQ